MNPTRRTALVVAAAMGATSLLAGIGKPQLDDAGAKPLDLDHLFPRNFGVWRLDEVTQAFVRPAAVQGRRTGIYDQVLERAFIGPGGERVMLSVAFGRQQSANLQLHRPEVCYRAAGYDVRDAQRGELTFARHRIPVTRLHTSLPGRPEPVTYWTLLGGVVVADADSFRLRRLQFAARRRLPDGMLVRVSTIQPDAAAGFELQRRFAEDLVAALAPADRAKVVGEPGA